MVSENVSIMSEGNSTGTLTFSDSQLPGDCILIYSVLFTLPCIYNYIDMWPWYYHSDSGHPVVK